MTDTRSFDRNVLKAEVRDIIDDVLPETTDSWAPARVTDRHRDQVAERIVNHLCDKVQNRLQSILDKAR